MATFSEAELESACVVVASSLGYPTLSEQQLRVLLSYIRGNDVFAVLPTGYGKSLCYAVLPMVFDRLLGAKDSVVVVITPLTAIIKDQVSS